MEMKIKGMYVGTPNGPQPVNRVSVNGVIYKVEIEDGIIKFWEIDTDVNTDMTKYEKVKKILERHKEELANIFPDVMDSDDIGYLVARHILSLDRNIKTIDGMIEKSRAKEGVL